MLWKLISRRPKKSMLIKTSRSALRDWWLGVLEDQGLSPKLLDQVFEKINPNFLGPYCVVERIGVVVLPFEVTRGGHNSPDFFVSLKWRRLWEAMMKTTKCRGTAYYIRYFWNRIRWCSQMISLATGRIYYSMKRLGCFLMFCKGNFMTTNLTRFMWARGDVRSLILIQYTCRVRRITECKS